MVADGGMVIQADESIVHPLGVGNNIRIGIRSCIRMADKNKRLRGIHVDVHVGVLTLVPSL